MKVRTNGITSELAEVAKSKWSSMQPGETFSRETLRCSDAGKVAVLPAQEFARGCSLPALAGRAADPLWPHPCSRGVKFFNANEERSRHLNTFATGWHVEVKVGGVDAKSFQWRGKCQLGISIREPRVENLFRDP
jgi:hypothetical protein